MRAALSRSQCIRAAFPLSFWFDFGTREVDYKSSASVSLFLSSMTKPSGRLARRHDAMRSATNFAYTCAYELVIWPRLTRPTSRPNKSLVPVVRPSSHEVTAWLGRDLISLEAFAFRADRHLFRLRSESANPARPDRLRPSLVD
ncbi:unnamed protein product [Protopolystoma xenopodis]|uniref:Uncharacterized protein n=1 Tax=Protopolystoma xenopodis TaxID=117903 RepID=A0A3S5A764_9PLAT|nr:unnamed protein product [Protopolystoma xenopodis]